MSMFHSLPPLSQFDRHSPLISIRIPYAFYSSVLCPLSLRFIPRMRIFPLLLRNPAPLIFTSLHTLPLRPLRPTGDARILRLSFPLAYPPRNLLHLYIQPATRTVIFLNILLSDLLSLLLFMTCIFRNASFLQLFLVYLSLLLHHILSLPFLFLIPRSSTTVKKETFLCSSHLHRAVPSVSRFRFQHRHPPDIIIPGEYRYPGHRASHTAHPLSMHTRHIFHPSIQLV